jgi:hypothetical protein
MNYQLIMESFPRSRKAHKCIWCGESIPVGEKYRHEISKYCGLQNHHWHLECTAASMEYFASGEEEFEAYENERPVKAERGA